MLKGQKVFVTGGTGFLGSHLLEHLIKAGADVTALYRSKSNFVEEQTEVTWIKGDLFTEGWDLKGFDIIYHLAGVVGYSPKERALMEKVNVQGTLSMLEKFKKEAPKAKFIHLSSVVAVGAGQNKKQILDETSQYNVKEYNFGYFETKKAAEEAVFKAAESGCFCLCLNPSTIYGARDFEKGSRSFQLKMARGNLNFYTEGGVSVVHVDDVCGALLKAPFVGRSGERYILSGDNITIKELLDEIAKEVGVKKAKFKLPTLLLLFLGYGGDFLNKIGIKTGLSLEKLKVATLYHWFDHSKAKKELGFSARPYEEALRDSLAWAKKEGIL